MTKEEARDLMELIECRMQCEIEHERSQRRLNAARAEVEHLLNRLQFPEKK